MTIVLEVTQDRHGELATNKRALQRQLQDLIDDGRGTDDGKPNIRLVVKEIRR